MLACRYYNQLERDIKNYNTVSCQKSLKVTFRNLPAADHQIKRFVSHDNWSIDCLQRNEFSSSHLVADLLTLI